MAPVQDVTRTVHQQNQSLTVPSMSQLVTDSPTPLNGGPGVHGWSLAELMMFMEKHQRVQQERDAQAKAEAKAERLERDTQAKVERAELEKKFESQLEAQRCEMAQLEQRLSEALPQAASDAISDEELQTFQERLQTLHEAKLLSDDDLCCLEDTVADCIEVYPVADVKHLCVDKTLRMLRLSEKMKVDASLARQLKRKFVG